MEQGNLLLLSPSSLMTPPMVKPFSQNQSFFADIFSGYTTSQAPFSFKQFQGQIQTAQDAIGDLQIWNPLEDAQFTSLPVTDETPFFTIKDHFHPTAETPQQWEKQLANQLSHEQLSNISDPSIQKNPIEQLKNHTALEIDIQKTTHSTPQATALSANKMTHQAGSLISMQTIEDPATQPPIDENTHTNVKQKQTPVLTLPPLNSMAERAVTVGEAIYRKEAGINASVEGETFPHLDINPELLKNSTLASIFELSNGAQSKESGLQALASNLPDAIKIQHDTNHQFKTTESAKLSSSIDAGNRIPLANPAPKLGQRLLQMVRRGESSIELRLDPPELGRLTVSLTVDKDNLNVQITASNSAVRDLLMTHDGRLRQALSEQGMSLADLSVNVQSEQQQNHHQMTSPHSNTLGIEVLADGTEVDQSFIASTILFKAHGGRLLDQFI